MRTLLRHAIALLLFGFVCKLAIQAQNNDDANSVPKALLLGSLAPSQAIPSGRIDARPIIAAIKNN
jgi:hypothetical protein